MGRNWGGRSAWAVIRAARAVGGTGDSGGGNLLIGRRDGRLGERYRPRFWRRRGGTFWLFLLFVGLSWSRGYLTEDWEGRDVLEMGIQLGEAARKLTFVTEAVLR